MHVKSILKLGLAEKWLCVMLTIMLTVAFFGYPGLASAEGATQISGVAYYADIDNGECTDIPLDPENGPHFVLKLTGDLEGCMYVFVEASECSPSGTYRDWGYEKYIIEGGAYGAGEFTTTYRFTSKFEGCDRENGIFTGAEIFGRCQHPIVPGSGTGDFYGVTGRLDFKDDLSGEVFEAPYKGHLKW